MRDRLLIALAALAALAWAIFVVWGLLEPYSEATRWVALVLGIISALTFLVLAVLGCRCLGIRREAYEPSPYGLVVGAALGLIIIVPLATYAYVGEYIVARDEYVRVLSELLWVFGVVGGIIVFLLIVAGIVVCIRGRHDEDDGSTDPVPPAPVRKKPDPWMYSQEWAKANGDVITWDNPSITVWDPVTNLEESRFDVVVGKEYRIEVEVGNGSAITPVQVECAGATMTVYSRIKGIGGPVEE
ncbi:MAG: hypothetical protein IIB62_06305, partial [Proteobacteria bacterium]|nr:hypothetical protein [Pseudomonadota bacterium]